MAILAFQKPDRVIMLEGTETVGRFEFRPLEPGYGQTIGNALRRILLSSLEGFAISSIKISGVDQEFATIPGVIEGMQDIILNLKQVRLKRMVDSVDSEVANITVSGKQEFTAEDISKGLSSFKVLNPELHICSLEPSVKLEISLTVTKGRGFVPAEEERDENTPIGTIPVDAIYTPIRKVNWTVENWRVEQKTDYEKLNLEIVTDGSISPNAALQDAANILIYHFKLFTDDKKLTLETARAEIQVITPYMIYAKEPPKIAKQLLGESMWNKIMQKTKLEGGLGHKFYEQWRLLNPKSKEAIEIAKKSVEYYRHFKN